MQFLLITEWIMREPESKDQMAAFDLKELLKMQEAKVVIQIDF